MYKHHAFACLKLYLFINSAHDMRYATILHAAQRKTLELFSNAMSHRYFLMQFNCTSNDVHKMRIYMFLVSSFFTVLIVLKNLSAQFNIRR